MASLSKAGAALTALREDLVGDVFAPGIPGTTTPALSSTP
ncbi:hypothetical protein SALBM311S_01750 [Streptomyces alboniger]